MRALQKVLAKQSRKEAMMMKAAEDGLATVNWQMVAQLIRETEARMEDEPNQQKKKLVAPLILKKVPMNNSETGVQLGDMPLAPAVSAPATASSSPIVTKGPFTMHQKYPNVVTPSQRDQYDDDMEPSSEADDSVVDTDYVPEKEDDDDADDGGQPDSVSRKKRRCPKVLQSPKRGTGAGIARKCTATWRKQVPCSMPTGRQCTDSAGNVMSSTDRKKHLLHIHVKTGDISAADVPAFIEQAKRRDAALRAELRKAGAAASSQHSVTEDAGARHGDMPPSSATPAKRCVNGAVVMLERFKQQKLAVRRLND